MPGTRKSRQLTDWMRLYVGLELAWDVRLLLGAGEATGARTGSGHQLARDCWLGACALGKVDDSLVYTPESDAFTRHMAPANTHNTTQPHSRVIA
jgi:type VI secretion system protein ImpH